ncbi:hypothetical protein ACFX5U_20790 [Sphingobacterium sp. SG20118]|uniref:hypothetical protein n=1 Tax=Sphingobacterium sp. SG20118 TaxID=3367156 RepID=UPI0037DFC616
MNKFMLIEQMQQALSQLVQHEVQTALSDIPSENLLQTIIDRFSSAPFPATLLPLMEECAELLSSHLSSPETPLNHIPEYVSIIWIIDKLDIKRSTFYRSVNQILLFPVLRVGKRPYYLKADVIALFDKTKGKGPYILGKLAHQVRQS